MVRRYISSVRKRMRHPWLEGVYRWSASHKRYFLLAILVFAIFVLFTEQVKALIILSVFGIVAAVTSFYKRVVRMPPFFEFISLTTVMVTLFYGPIVAIIYAVIVNIGSEAFSGYPDVMILTYIPSRGFQVLFIYFASQFTGMGVVALGVWSVIAFNLVQQPIFMSLTDAEHRLKALYYAVLNIPANIIIFNLLGNHLYSVLQAIV